jgi:hypothetical protein
MRGHIRRLVRRIRMHWPNMRPTIYGDGHYARPEVMTWCEANALEYIFGLPGNAVLSRLVELPADDQGAPRRSSSSGDAATPRHAMAANPGSASAG